MLSVIINYFFISITSFLMLRYFAGAPASLVVEQYPECHSKRWNGVIKNYICV